MTTAVSGIATSLICSMLTSQYWHGNNAALLLHVQFPVAMKNGFNLFLGWGISQGAARKNNNKDSDMWQLIKESCANQLPLEDHATLSSNKLSSLSCVPYFSTAVVSAYCSDRHPNCYTGQLSQDDIYKVNIWNILAVRQHPISKPPQMGGSCFRHSWEAASFCVFNK